MTLSGFYYKVRKSLNRWLNRYNYNDLRLAKRKLNNLRLKRAYQNSLKDLKNVKLDTHSYTVKRKPMS